MNVINNDLKSIYDLFALCCDHVMKACEKGDFSLPDCSNDEEYDAIEDAIAEYLCNREIEGKRLALKQLLSRLLEVLGLEPTLTPSQTFKIAKAIDGKVSIEEPIPEDEFSQFVTYSSLNRHLQDRIRIFPVLESTFISRMSRLHKERTGGGYPLLRNEKPAAAPISSHFNYYIIMDKPRIEAYPLKVVRARMNGEFCRTFANKNVLKIDIVPFTQVDIEEVGHIRCEGDYFWMEGIRTEQEKRLAEKQKKFFRDREREKADFIIFPEMFFSDMLLDFSRKYAGPDEMVVNGSIWQDGRNKCVVSLRGAELFRHYKRCAFEYKKKLKRQGREEVNIYKEKLTIPLDHRRRVYQILEIEGFGRVAVGICRDLDYGETQDLWRTMQTNLLLIPAYTGSDDMVNSARALTSLYNMVVILDNACAAVKPLKEEECGAREDKPIGFVMFPGIKDGKRCPVVEYYYKTGVCAGCKDVCKGHRLIISLEKTAKSSQQVLSFEGKWEGA